MNDEQFIALALPHSVADDPHDGFHVSVYLSPKLIAGPNATLGDFPTLRDWASLANGPTGIEIELVSQAGTIPVTRIDRAVPADWKALFPHDTPVADATTPRSPDEPSPPQQVPDWSDRPWESYPVSETAGYAKALLLATILSDPVTPVPPSLHPITPSVVKFFDKHRAIDYGTREGYDTGSTRFPAPLPEAVGEMDREASAARRAYLRADAARDEAIVAYGKWRADYVKEIIFDTDDPLLIEVREDILTAALDSARTNRMYRSSLAMLPPGTSLDDQTAAAFSDLHETRRFYEEPDPDPTANRIQEQQSEPRPLPPRAPEFHERVAAAGDHPELLRRLGLVIDVTADPTLLRQAQWLVVRMRAQDAPADLVRSPKVWVRAQDDGGFVAIPEPGREAEWQDGRLALGDESFQVVDVDPDGSALKTERFVVSLPRMLKVQANHDPVDAASPALRATGLAIARTGQLGTTKGQFDRQTVFQEALRGVPDPHSAPDAYVHDVARGLRIEVFDTRSGRWHSLHRRVATMQLGDGADDYFAYRDHAEDGLLQGTAARENPDAATPAVKIHETVFGWDGWSLSVARPSRRIRPEIVRNDDDTAWTLKEVSEDADTSVEGEVPPHPFVFSARIERGTLPRLRYGRRYAFRAWIVDLAGNVRPHTLESTGADATGIRALLTPALFPTLLSTTGLIGPSVAATGLREAAISVAASRANPSHDEAAAAADVRAAMTEALRVAVVDETPEAVAAIDPLLLLPDVAAVFDVVAARTSAHRTNVDLAASVRAAAAGLTAVPSVRAASPQLIDEIAELASSLLDGRPPAADTVRDALTGATDLHPFLRWDPVPPPAIVARRELTEAESLRVLVIRSGVSQAEPGADVIVTAPLVNAERHLAPPHTSQQQAELHGMFDGSLDGRAPGDTTAQRAAIRLEELAWALRESGTLFDRRRAPLDHPASVWPEQPGARLVIPPAAEARAALDAIGHVPPKPPKRPADETRWPNPVVPHGEPAPSGSYVVHDTDRMELPYLPDPLAAGVSLRFIDAGRSLRAEPPRSVHLTTAPFEGTWPDIKPFRLVMRTGAVADAVETGRDIEIAVPPGTQQRFTLASSLDDSGLAKLAVWDALDPAFTELPEIQTAARDGILWGLTPGELVTLVHAVPRPVTKPSFGGIFPLRAAGQRRVVLLGMAYAHGASTQQLTAEARWTDVTDSAPEGAASTVAGDVAFTTVLEPHETELLLGAKLDLGTLQGHEAVHTFPDTKHRVVSYVLRASTRYREFFPAAELTPTGGADQWPLDDGQSVLSARIDVDVPSAAPPPPPDVNAVLPLFRWEDAAEPDQPFARRRTRRPGVRIYLERGWYASGAGELLGVALGRGNPPADKALDDAPYVSQWGNDPAWDAVMVADRRLRKVDLQDLAAVFDPLQPARPGRPVRVDPVVLIKPAAADDSASGPPDLVSVAGYVPSFSTERNLWYVDILFESARTHWPFVRLSLVRFQPSSVLGCHLSTPVRADFVQLTPERTLTVGRPDAHRVSVSLVGEFGQRLLDDHDRPLTESPGRATMDAAYARSNRVRAKLQRRAPLIGGDLGWSTVTSIDLEIGGRGATDTEVLWLGTIDLAEPLPLQRPLAQPRDDETAPEAAAGEPSSDWRIQVEEWQHVPGDAPAGDPDEGEDRNAVWEQRLVYSDHLYL